MFEVTSTLTIRSLVCHRDVDMALACLGSLLRFSHDPLRLVLHDDGSLTSEDIQRLLTGLEGSTIVLRSEADELMNQLLKNHPYSYKYRYEQAYSLKLLDIPLLSKGDIAYCDTDVLFLRPFYGMFRQPSLETSAVFMMDGREAYSVTPWFFLGSSGLKLPSKVNTGFMFIQKKAYDLDFIEWCLGKEEFKYAPVWFEQTCWAAMVHRIGCQLLNPQQVAVMQARKNQNVDELVAGHFTSRIRYLLSEFIPKINSITQEKLPVKVETIPSQECNPLMLAHSLLRHKGGIKIEQGKRILFG